jgi:histidinol-phosphate aminotransferase
VLQVRPTVLTMPGYTPGRSIDLVMRERGLTDIIKLASNESLWGPSTQVIEAIHDHLASLYHYPDVIPQGLVERLAQQSGFSEQEILVGCGADELLRLVATAYVSPGDRVLYPTPSFAAYAYGASLMAGEGVPIALTGDGRMNLDAVAAAMTANTSLIYLCSPNNPTGGIFSQTDWDQFVNRIDGRALIVVDQAYREFVDDPTYAQIEGAIYDGQAVAMVRTFSKLYGLAGARVGWMAAPASIIGWLRRVREPFSLNAVGIAGAEAALVDASYYEAVRQETLALRQWLRLELEQRGYAVLPSQANFLTFAVGSDAATWATKLEQHGVIIRDTTSFGLAGHLRVTIAPKPYLERFLVALENVRAGS